MAVYGLMFSKLATLVIAPEPLPFSTDTPAEIKGMAGSQLQLATFNFCCFVIVL